MKKAEAKGIPLGLCLFVWVGCAQYLALRADITVFRNGGAGQGISFPSGPQYRNTEIP